MLMPSSGNRSSDGSFSRLTSRSGIVFSFRQMMKHSPSRSSAQPQIEGQGASDIKIVKRSQSIGKEIVTKTRLEQSLYARSSGKLYSISRAEHHHTATPRHRNT